MKLKQHWLLIVILVLAAALRLVGLGRFPASLYWEETALGYDAYSLWKTGKDFHGNPWPIVAFESFGDYKPSGYYYLTAPFVGILGLNNWSVRLPSALAGILTVWLVYLIGRELFADKKVGLLAALALAIMPWHIQFSRAAFEVNVATFWLTLGVWCLLKTRQKTTWVVPAGSALVAAMYTYHGLRLLTPLIALFVGLIYLRKKLFSPWLIGSVVVCIGLLLPILVNIRNPSVSQRFAETSLFSTSPAVAETNALRQADGNTWLSRLIHHRYGYWGKEIVTGMASHLSPRFLFLDGDGTQRHQTGYTALLYWWMIVPLVIVVGTIRRKDSPLWMLCGWILLATIPPALTNVSPHTLRFLPAAPAFALLIGYGLAIFIKTKRRWLIGGLAIWVVLEGFMYGFDYATSYTVRSSPDWQYGYEEVVQFIKAWPNTTEPVQVTRTYGRPSMYFLYYLAYDPKTIQQQASLLPKDQGELLTFDRFTFGPIDTHTEGLVVNDQPLAVGSLVHQINFPTNRPAFYIYEIK